MTDNYEALRKALDDDDPWGSLTVMMEDPVGAIRALIAERDALAARVRELEADAGRWQPIESAPEDGSWILVAGHDRTGAERMVVRWCSEGFWESADDGYSAYINPTHWTPLPAPPGAARGEHQAPQ